MEKKRITILPHVFDSNDYFLLKFNYDESLISIAQSIGCRWVVEDEGWAIYRSKSNLNTLVRAFGDIAIVDTSKIGFNSDRDENTLEFSDIPEEYLELLIQEGYDDKKIQVYASLFREFVHFFKGKDLKKISAEEIADYQKYLIQVKKVSGSTRIKAFHALKLYFEKILKWDWDQFEKAAQESELNDRPLDQISEKEITRMINVTQNLKHKAIIDLLYFSGLQSYELINLRIDDVNFDKKEVLIKGEKEVPDRFSILLDESKHILSSHLKLNKPSRWLFEDQEGNQYSVSSILSLIRRASFKAGLGKVTGMQILQSSFDSQLIEEENSFEIPQDSIEKKKPFSSTGSKQFKQGAFGNLSKESPKTKNSSKRKKNWGS